MKVPKFVFLAGLCLAYASLLSSALAFPIGPGAFSGGETIESFEGLSPGPNIPSSSSYGPAYLVPGNLAPYTFSSGVTLTAPIPNGNDGNVILIGDFALGFATWGLGLERDH
jgi:hypothetical protein